MPSRELQDFIQSLFEWQATANPTPPLDEWREAYEALGREYPAEPNVGMEEIVAGGVRAAWLIAGSADRHRSVLYFHGGSYVMGSITTHLAITSRLTGTAGARVLAVDYRLAPEHKFPAAVEDCVAVWRWLVDQGQDPKRAAFVGDSAGGGLVIAAMLLARDRGLPLPACGVAISPFVDHDGWDGWRAADPAVDPMVMAASLDRCVIDYLGENDVRDPYASPLYGDLAGLPPLLVQVGTAEILLSDSTRLSERARSAGVDVTLEIEQGAPHVWHHTAPVVPEAVAAIDRVGRFIKTLAS